MPNPTFIRGVQSFKLSAGCFCTRELYRQNVLRARLGAVFISQRCCQSQSSPAEGQRWRMMFFGTDHFSLPHLQMIEKSRENGNLIDRLEVVVPESKFIKRRGRTRRISPVWDFCLEHGLTCHQWPLPRNPSGFDVGVVVSFGHLLPDSLIKSFPLGILNVHPSLLPRWRGGAPIQHTILNGDHVSGVSIMRILPDRFDIGPILLQQECPVLEGSTRERLSKRLAKMGSEMLLEVLSNLTEFIEKEVPQKEEGVTLGLKIPSKMAWIDWKSSVCDIDRLYRAIGGQMSLKTLYGEEELRLDMMVPPAEFHDVPVREDCDAPGSVMFNKQKNVICVRCRDGWVGFQSLSPIGRKQMTAKEFYNGYLSSRRDADKLHRFLNRATTNR